MALTVTDTRTTITEMDGGTSARRFIRGNAFNNLSGNGTQVSSGAPSAFGDNGTFTSTNIDLIEADRCCMGATAGSANGKGIIFENGLSLDLTDTLVYAWMIIYGAPDTQANGGLNIVLGDGTNRIAFAVAGSDNTPFRYSTARALWYCLVLDTDNIPSVTNAIAGSLGSLDYSSITEVGIACANKASVITGVNLGMDIARYGADGFTITGGSGGAGDNFQELADAETFATGEGFGLFAELFTDSFEAHGPLTFGDDSGTLSLDFLANNQQVLFRDRGFGVGRNAINVVGNGTGTTTFQLGDKLGAAGGENGVTIRSLIGVGCSMDLSDSNVDEILFYGSTFDNIDQSFVFSNSANAADHEVFACRFINCATVDPGDVAFENNIFVGAADSNGAILIDADGTSNWADLTFQSDGTGHAIYITAAGTYDFDNFSYSGYASSDGSTGNEVIYNNSGGAVTINVNGGDTPTVRNGASASTTVNSSVSVEVTVIDEAGDPVEDARVILRTASDTIIDRVLTNASGVASGTYSGSTPVAIVDSWVRKASSSPFYQQGTIAGSITSNGFAATITLLSDE